MELRKTVSSFAHFSRLKCAALFSAACFRLLREADDPKISIIFSAIEAGRLSFVTRLLSLKSYPRAPAGVDMAGRPQFIALDNFVDEPRAYQNTGFKNMAQVAASVC